MGTPEVKCGIWFFRSGQKQKTKSDPQLGPAQELICSWHRASAAQLRRFVSSSIDRAVPISIVLVETVVITSGATSEQTIRTVGKTETFNSRVSDWLCAIGAECTFQLPPICNQLFVEKCIYAVGKALPRIGVRA